MATPTQEYPTKQSDGFWNILGNTFQLIGASWQGLLLNLKTFIFLLLISMVSLIAFVAVALVPTGILMANESSTVTVNAASIIAGTVGLVGLILLMILLTTATTLTTLASARNKVVSLGDVLTESQSLLGKVFVLGVLVILAVVFGLLLLIIPGLAAIFFLTLATYVLVDKKCSPIEAMKESFELTKRNWKIVLSYFVVSTVIQFPSVVPILGDLVTFALTIVYLCLPAILYVRIQQQNPVSAPIDHTKTTTSKQAAKKPAAK